MTALVSGFQPGPVAPLKGPNFQSLAIPGSAQLGGKFLLSPPLIIDPTFNLDGAPLLRI